jgi:hypothetical protein
MKNEQQLGFEKQGQMEKRATIFDRFEWVLPSGLHPSTIYGKHGLVQQIRGALKKSQTLNILAKESLNPSRSSKHFQIHKFSD